MNDILKRILLTAMALIIAVVPFGIAESAAAQWNFGFGRCQIIPDETSAEPMYIAGYNQAAAIDGVLDYCEARAVWIDAGGQGVLMIGVDSIALSSGTAAKIRAGLEGIENCAAVNVYSTHSHASPDTLGLWGPVGEEGKNSDYMNALVKAAISAGQEAAQNVKPGRLYYGKVETDGAEMLRDSRFPYVFDANLHQLRFEAADGSAGLRMFFYCAHAESLRSDNRMISRDYPGLLCDNVTAATGDNTIFAPGAVGGLLMTKEFVDTSLRYVENLEITGEKMTAYALSIAAERELSPEMTFCRTSFTVPMENPVFLLYYSMGILDNNAFPGDSPTGFVVESEVNVLMLDGVAVAMIPGEIFPELVYGGEYGLMNPDGENPQPLTEIAAQYGVDDLLIIGLCNDELGYIVPPSDFLLNAENPYLSRITDSLGEDHYEETNSVGPQCAGAIAAAFEKSLADMTE